MARIEMDRTVRPAVSAPWFAALPGRRGVASVMAMLFMVVFSALALGFYAATTTASQVANNEKTATSARLAAEAGVEFLSYHLASLDIPDNLTPSQIFDEVYMQLATRMDTTPNLGGSRVGYDAVNITIPQVGYVKLDPRGEQQFRINISLAGDVLVTKVIGRSGGASIGRGIEIKFQKATNATAIFNFGVASRGPVSTTGQSTITGLTDPTKGSVLSTNTTSATPISIMGKLVSGDLSTVSETAAISWANGTSIGGTSSNMLITRDHIHKGVPEPRFPDVDTTVYATYATNTYVTGMNQLDNVRIPAGTNPSFSGNTLIRGVLYVEAPNRVSFGGNVTVQGMIVVQNGAPLDMTNNLLDFSGSVVHKPASTLPASFGNVRALDGVFVLADKFRVKMWGNFGLVHGHIIASQFQMGGSAEGTIEGSIITTADLPTTIDGSADVVIASTGTTQYPAGVTFGIHYTSIPGSYLEVPAN
jgi:hypothetical protein